MNNVPSVRSLTIGSIISLVLLAFIYTYPRVIIAWLGEQNPWTSYLYQYGYGLIFFLMGIYIILRSGACRPGRGHDSAWLKVLFAGFVFFAALHAVWILAALNFKFMGGQ